MKRRASRKVDPAQALASAARRLPEVEEGIACAGNALEKRTLKARNKAFLFLGKGDAMLKLSDSLADASALAARDPNRYKVGAHGWVTITFGEAKSLPIDLLETWVEESYRLLAPRQLLAISPNDDESPAKRTTTKKSAVRNRTSSK